MSKLPILFSIILIFVGCEVKPHKFNFGSDNCHFCKMTIVDKQHAAQVVTSKGKAFKYDAIECMMNHISQWDGPEIKLFLVSNYANHESLIDAKTATFLESEGIPSPMGANLSAFRNREDAVQARNELGGETFDWEELKEKFKAK